MQTIVIAIRNHCRLLSCLCCHNTVEWTPPFHCAMPTARSTSANVLELWFHQMWGGGLENWEVYPTHILLLVRVRKLFLCSPSYIYIYKNIKTIEQKQQKIYVYIYISMCISIGTHRLNRSRLWPRWPQNELSNSFPIFARVSKTVQCVWAQNYAARWWFCLLNCLCDGGGVVVMSTYFNRCSESIPTRLQANYSISGQRVPVWSHQNLAIHTASILVAFVSQVWVGFARWQV